MIERTQTRPPRRASLRRAPPGDLAAPKNHRFLEVLALLNLITHWFTAAGPPTPAADLLLAVHTVAALVALGALVYPPLRRAAWVSFLMAGLLAILVTPGSFSGILLVLLGAFLISDSGWAGRRPLAIAGGLAGLTVAAQVGSCLVHPDGLVRQVVQRGLVDTLVLVLPVSFRKNVAIKVEDHRPTWILEAFKLTSQEGQVLHLFRSGLTSKEIAAELKKSDNAVRIVLSKIYKKTGVANAKELFTPVRGRQTILGESGESGSEGRGKIKV